MLKYSDIISKLKYNIKTFENKSVLIAGSTGSVGSGITRFFLELKNTMNVEIYIISRNKDKARKMFTGEYYILDYDLSKNILIEGKYDYIFNAAGYANANYIRTNPIDIIAFNVTCSINLLNCAAKNKSKYILISTREVYGELSSNYITETDLLNCRTNHVRNCYPISKITSENLCECYNSQYNVPYTIFRLGHAYGPEMNINKDGRVLNDILGMAFNEKNINLKSNGLMKRSFCYITDVVYGIILGTLHSKNDIYNIVNNYEYISIIDLSKLVSKIIGGDNIPINTSTGDSDQMIKEYSLSKLKDIDTSKLENLGWKCTTSLNEGLQNTINSIRKLY